METVTYAETVMFVEIAIDVAPKMIIVEVIVIRTRNFSLNDCCIRCRCTSAGR